MFPGRNLSIFNKFREKKRLFEGQWGTGAEDLIGGRMYLPLGRRL